MKKLTVIIPFLNEGIEIENTVQNIRKTAGNNVDILLIDDCSWDGVDYKAVSEKYNTKFTRNSKRMGVAESRNIGVSMIETDYFIIMDGHMRYYQNDWWQIAVEQLETDDRAAYCFACSPLSPKGERTKLSESGRQVSMGYGSYFGFYGHSFNCVLEPAWISYKREEKISEIPCVLGASYIMSKRYWDYLEGLSMLRYYGADEAYLSLKVWLEGGSCKVISDVDAGHIFRSRPPYQILNVDSFYNKLLIAETVLPRQYANYIHASMRAASQDNYYIALSLLNKYQKEILELKDYYKSIFTRDFSFIEKLNEPFEVKSGIKKKNEEFFYKEKVNDDNLEQVTDTKLEDIASSVSQEPLKSKGLMTGGIGQTIFLFEYSRYKNNDELKKKAEEHLEQILESDEISSCNLQIGSSGLALGLSYLFENKHIEEDYSEAFEDIEEDMFEEMKADIERGNISYMIGALGVGRYFLNREKQDCVEYLITKIKEYADSLTPESRVSLTIDDGIPALLRFLLQAYNKGYTSAADIINRLVRFLLSQVQDFQKYGSCFSIRSNTDGKSGLAWFEGDLAIGYILLQASKVLGDTALYEKTIEILNTSLLRIDVGQEAVNDASFYTGSSGIAYLYFKLYQLTDDQAFDRACKHWQKETLYKAVGKDDLSGYIHNAHLPKASNWGLQSGIAGIGLSLLSIQTKKDLINDFF